MLFCNSIKVSLEKFRCIFLAPLCFSMQLALANGVLVGIIGKEALLCVHTLACPLALLPSATRWCLDQLRSKEYWKTYGVAWTQVIAWSQDQNVPVGVSRSRGYIQCCKWEINAYYFKSLEFRHLELLNSRIAAKPCLMYSVSFPPWYLPVHFS